MESKNVVAATIVVWLAATTLTGLYLKSVLPSKAQSVVPPLENGVRLAFFADLHITNSHEGAESDLPGPTYEIPRDAKEALNNVNPNYIFGLGDSTARSEPDEWEGYNSWINDLNAPVFDILGNTDKDHFIYVGNYGTGYFTEVGRVSGTKVLKMGNNVFILVSEEHNPEMDANNLASTIPAKRFEFIEKYLEEYSGDNNNIFIMSHIPLSGTTAFSDSWFYGNNPNWVHISDKFMNLLYTYENDVVAHMSGHIHIEYRLKDEPNDAVDGTYGVENVGKFVYGPEINNSNREYPPYSLPNIYFLNMRVVDIGHGALARGPLAKLLYSIGKAPKSAESGEGTKLKPCLIRAYAKLMDVGLPIFDFIHGPATSDFISPGRSAIYYFDMKENSDYVDIITRWTGGNCDVESYRMNLNHPIELGDGVMHFVASDLSLRDKEDLEITLDNWFKIESGTTGQGVFSKRYAENVFITGLSIDNYNLESYSAEWQGSTDNGKTWSGSWTTDPEDMGSVNAVMIRINFKASDQNDAYVEDIKLIEAPS